MKKFKFIIGLFALTTLLSINNIKAGAMTYTSITIPSMNGVYTTDSETKTTWSEQYIHTIGAVDKLSGDDRIIEARLKDITTSYVTATEGSNVQLNAGSTDLGIVPGSYQLQLRASKWTVSSVYYTGTWYLDDNVM